MYENIDFTTTRGSELSPDSGEETIQTPGFSTHLDVCLPLQNEGAETGKPSPAVQGKPYTTVLLMFGLLVVLVVVDIGVRVKIYHSVLRNVEKTLQTCFENHTKEPTELQKFQCQDQNCTEWQELRESHFYYASTEKKNWAESREDCKNRGGDLVIVNNREKTEMIGRMKLHGDSWIGLRTSNEWTVKWKWVDGSELGYRHWNQEVNVKEQPGLMAFTNQQGLWMHDKTGLKYWICEIRNVKYFGDLKSGKNINKI